MPTKPPSLAPMKTAMITQMGLTPHDAAHDFGHNSIVEDLTENKRNPKHLQPGAPILQHQKQTHCRLRYRPHEGEQAGHADQEPKQQAQGHFQKGEYDRQGGAKAEGNYHLTANEPLQLGGNAALQPLLPPGEKTSR